MNKYLKSFLLRGLIFGGFGPVILGIVYFCISIFHHEITLDGTEILLGIISVYILAFVHAGASIFNQIEEWGLNKSIAFHFGTLYLAYSLCYLINSWIPFDIKVFGIFTAIFVAVYLVIWTIVYLCVRRSSKKLNAKLKANI